MSKREVVTYNWIPKSFQEFVEAVRADHVDLNFMPGQKQRLTKYLNQFAFGYNNKLLQKMIADEAVYKVVHDDVSVDLILYK